MKHLSLLITASLFSIMHIHAQSDQIKTESFKVYGNCGMCKNTIEKAAKSVKGVNSAVWDVKTDTISVSYDIQLTDSNSILQAIADKGYDSDSHRATDEAYYRLPGCCQYDRPEKNK